MDAPKGHAAFHLEHNSSITAQRRNRKAILGESMRHLDPKQTARHARKNSNIVVADTRLNSAFVNDGKGGFKLASKVGEVLDYGDVRRKRVRRKIGDEHKTLSRFVVHLPKTMCVEIKDYYPRTNPDGSPRVDPETGEPLSRSRWVAKDPEQAMKYFRRAVKYLGDEVIPGGHDAIHGWATNFDESTPHIQLMADVWAQDPKNPDALRTEYSRAYNTHRDVRDSDGKQMPKQEKMRLYQAGLRECMIDSGFPVEAEVSARHGKSLSPAEYKEAADMKAEAELKFSAAEMQAQENENAMRQHDAQIQQREDKVRQQSSKLVLVVKRIQHDQDELLRDRAEIEQDQNQLKQEQDTWRQETLPALRKKAVAEAKQEVKDEMKPQLDKMVREAKEEANRQSQRLRKVSTDMQRYFDEHPKVQKHFAAWRGAQPAPEAQQQMFVTVEKLQKDVATKEPSVMDTFKANVREEEPESNTKDYSAAYAKIWDQPLL